MSPRRTHQEYRVNKKDEPRTQRIPNRLDELLDRWPISHGLDHGALLDHELSKSSGCGQLLLSAFLGRRAHWLFGHELLNLPAQAIFAEKPSTFMI